MSGFLQLVAMVGIILVVLEISDISATLRRIEQEIRNERNKKR